MVKKTRKQTGGVVKNRVHPRAHQSNPKKNWNFFIIPALCAAFAAVGVVLAERWWGGPLVSRPLAVPPAVSSDWRNGSIYDKRLWGSYRSNVYFGMRPRIPKSLVVGTLWFTYTNQLSIRHSCEHGDSLAKYGWTRHDGTSFGQQQIIDNAITLETDFVTMTGESSLGDTWTGRVTIHPHSNQPQLVSLIFYIYNEGAGEMAYAKTSQNIMEEIYGHTPEFSQFRLHFPNKLLPKDAVHSYMSARLPTIAHLSDRIKSLMRRSSPRKKWPPLALLPGDVLQEGETKLRPNFIAYQVTAFVPFSEDVVFEAGPFSAAFSVSGDKFTSELERRRNNFDLKFEEKFGLEARGFDEDEVNFAKAAFSNLIGGISYFYGKSKVISKETSLPVDYWAASLYTAVPSRSFFPRGFLWDEGFHQLLVAHWDTSIAKDVIAHWMDLLNVEGWIPREQILGEEALSKVPKEFVVQHNENANPPTFFLTLDTLLSLMEKQGEMDLVYLKKLYPRLQVWFNWFNLTQSGPVHSTYRWRGRNSTTDMELNPKTLTSGLDDYPRASHPSDDEYHVDLRCWMSLAAGVMARIAGLVQEDAEPYQKTHQLLSDPKLLDRMHWDNKRKMYSDYGLHSTSVKLVKIQSPHPNIPSVKKRRMTKDPTLRFVNSFGYVSLFPFLLKIVPPSSEKLGYILNRIRNESILWTDYGLRSLSKSDRIYKKYNTEHDPPYWRGAIWINMNAMAVRALHHYGSVEGPHRVSAHKIYQELRANLIRNMYSQYLKTGYIWEQYDDITGAGKGTHPFTGWSSLIVMIMSEKY